MADLTPEDRSLLWAMANGITFNHTEDRRVLAAALKYIDELEAEVADLKQQLDEAI